VTISDSLMPFPRRRWVDEGVDEPVPDWRFEKRSSRSLSLARSALCLAVSCALRYCARELCIQS
jgi:hypothetical protein